MSMCTLIYEWPCTLTHFMTSLTHHADIILFSVLARKSDEKHNDINKLLSNIFIQIILFTQLEDLWHCNIFLLMICKILFRNCKRFSYYARTHTSTLFVLPIE